MKLLLLISLACYIVACIHLTTANPSADADPWANADPDPLVGSKVTKTCESSMGNITSHQELCRKVADRVVDKFSKACHKAIKYACKLTKFSVNYKNCCDAMIDLICPANKPPLVVIEGESNPTTTEAPKSDDKHPSWIGRVIINKCDKHLKPIADNITENGKQPFQTKAFCNQLGAAGKDVCISSLIGRCEHFPKNWTSVIGICKEYVVPWICK